MNEPDTTSPYVDSFGRTRPAMLFSEALETVHSLATLNLIDDVDIAFGDDGLKAQAAWQSAALDTVHDLVVNHHERLDDLALPARAGEWPDAVVGGDRSLDPERPLQAVRICLASAEEGVLDPDEAEGMDEEAARQRQALDVVADLVGTHGREIEAIIPVAGAP